MKTLILALLFSTVAFASEGTIELAGNFEDSRVSVENFAGTQIKGDMNNFDLTGNIIFNETVRQVTFHVRYVKEEFVGQGNIDGTKVDIRLEPLRPLQEVADLYDYVENLNR